MPLLKIREERFVPRPHHLHSVVRVGDWSSAAAPLRGRLQAGVWDLIHSALLGWLARDDQIDWSRAVVDSCCIRAVYGGDQTGPNPTDRAKRGSKRHLICDGRGVPLAVRLTGANRNDSQEALALVDAIAPLHGERRRPRQRPDCVLGDRGYDAAAIRRGLRTRHIVPLLAMRAPRTGVGGPPERMPTSPAPIARSPFVVIASAPLLSGRGAGIGLDYGRNTGPIFAPEVSTSTAARLSNLLPASINRGG